MKKDTKNQYAADNDAARYDGAAVPGAGSAHDGGTADARGNMHGDTRGDTHGDTHEDVRDDKPRHGALIVAVLLVAAGFAYLIYGGIAKNLVWDMTPTQLLAQGVKAYDHPVRLGGLVVPGTVKYDDDKTGVQFHVRDTSGPDIDVHSKGIPSAMFREGIGVVLEGKYQENGGQPVFNATTLMVKHSNEYKPPVGMNAKASDTYKTLIKD